jgi:IclR family transcriptional regulator, mhp operon transcriptional activator
MRQYKVEPITALARGLQVLRVLQDIRAASLHDLHLATGLPKSTLTRILLTCHQQGLVWQRMADGAFVASYAFLDREHVDDAGWLVEVASPVLEKLLEHSMWPSVLSVPRLDYMETLETNSRQAYFDEVRRSPVGYRVNMLRSASGRAYLAACPQQEREAVLRRLREQAVPGHERARDDAWVATMIAETRERGYAVRDPDFGGDYARGRSEADDQRDSIALAIRNEERVLGCINLTWRRHVRTLEQVVDTHLADLRAAVVEIEQRVSDGTRARETAAW